MIGKTISHYKILEKLGEGGMGVVYRAEDTRLRRTVALKFLPAHLTSDPKAKERFIQEARSASALDHNHICTIHEVGETEDGQIFIVMAYYDGETIKEKIARGPMRVNDALDIITRVAKGLAKAHNRGIVHRDIKPANIMVTNDGVVKILDFGVAKLTGQEQLTRTGTTMGTAAYMSPEQARCGEIDNRTDIWSLGVVLYEMVTGRLPFKGDHEQAVLYSIVNEKPAPATSVRKDLPHGLDHVLDTALEKNTDARYQTVHEFVADLGLVKATIGTTALPAFKRSARPSRLGWSVVAIVVIVTLCYMAISDFLTDRDGGSSAGRKMIVVLPFENLGLPEDEYFADGITEELTARLAKIGELGVIARTSAIRYKDTDQSIGQIGEELGVDYVLEGTIRWERMSEGQSQVRVTPQLVRVSDETHVWADIYQRDMTSIFEVQSDIAEKVASALDITLLEPTREAIEAKPTENLEAYNAYLRGIDLMGVPDYREETRELAIQMLEHAVELDPDFAVAHAELSAAHSSFFNLGYNRSKERVAKAKTAVDRAVELDPDHPVVHRALGYYYYWCHGEYDRALEEFAIAANGLPNDFSVLKATAYVLRRKGEFEKAIEKMKRGLEISPQDADMAFDIGSTYTPMRHYAEAEKYFKLSIALAPGQDASYHNLGWTYRMWQSDTVKPRALLEKIPLHDDQLALSWYTQSIFERDYRAALRYLESGPQDQVFVLQWWYWPIELLEGVARRLLGETEHARAAFEAARIRLEALVTEQPDDSRLHSSLGIVYAGLDRKEDAIREGRFATELVPVSKDAFVGPRHVEDLALIYTMVGEYDAALDEIEYMLSIPSYFSVGLLRLDPRWDPLRDDSRYEGILAQYGEGGT